MQKTIVGKMESPQGTVNVNRVEGMSGYEFEAVGMHMLPLAVEMAGLQAHYGTHYIEQKLGLSRAAV